MQNTILYDHSLEYTREEHNMLRKRSRGNLNIHNIQLSEQVTKPRQGASIDFDRKIKHTEDSQNYLTKTKYREKIKIPP